MQARVLDYHVVPIRVVVVDDCVVLRQGICLMLKQEGDFEVVGEAENEPSALRLIKAFQPDTVLLNNHLGTLNGLHTAKRLLCSCPEARIVLVSGSDDPSVLFRALRIGVYGYLHASLSIE